MKTKVSHTCAYLRGALKSYGKKTDCICVEGVDAEGKPIRYDFDIIPLPDKIIIQLGEIIADTKSKNLWDSCEPK
jgi:hypothetical protein